MAESGNVGAIKKLNNNNYSMWRTCMESYLQGQDLYEIIADHQMMMLAISENGELNMEKSCLLSK